jgi:porin
MIAILIYSLAFHIQFVNSQELAEPEAAPAEQEYDALFGSWGGLKDSLLESGITIEAAVTGNIMGLVSGGLDRGIYQTFAYQLTTTIDSESAGLWSNGTFLFSGLALTGGPLHNKVGDYQWSSNIDSYGVDTLQLYEAWYEHSFMEGKLTVLAGLHEYNSDFYSLDYASTLINSSFAFGPEVSQVGNSTYPITSLAARVRIQPTENSYLALAVYDGVPGNPKNYGRTSVILEKKDGLFYAAEAGITSTEEDSVTDYFKLAVGGWYQTTNFIDYADRERSNNSGAYIIAERKILSEESDPAQGLGVFGQFGLAQGDRNFIAQYLGAGLHYTGLICGRDLDIATFGVASAMHGDDYLNDIEGSVRAETALEASYRINLGHGIAIQPDVQYIVNPGLTTDENHAVVVGTRIDIIF